MHFFHSACLMITLPVLSFAMEQTRTPEEQVALASLSRLSITRSESPASRPTASQPIAIPYSPRNRSVTSSPNPHGQHSYSTASYSPHSFDRSRGISPESANSGRERSPIRTTSHSVPPTGRRNSWEYPAGYWDFPSASGSTRFIFRPSAQQQNNMSNH